MRTETRRAIREGVQAGSVAGVISGAPSTLYSLVVRGDPLEATIAAGSMLLPDEDRRARLTAAAIPVHYTLSAFWGVILAASLPRTRPVVTGTVAGLLIGTLDLVLVGRLLPRIRALPIVPQLADHIVFGVAVARLLQGSRK